jgi:uncharacterized protein (TIGR03790 family)
MKKIFIILCIIFPTIWITAQSIDYKDVAVIINENSEASITIGEYFQEKRNIPDQNIIRINCSTDDVIDSADFFSIVNQVSDYLINHNLSDSINYLVTTKGIPLTFFGEHCDSTYLIGCTAVDSELTLIINHPEEIGQRFFENSYYNLNQPFSEEEFNMYLVTRLDGYTVEDVLNLIDRSGPLTKVNKSYANLIFDLAFVYDTNTAKLFNKVLSSGYEEVISSGWNAIYSPDPDELLTNQSNVIGYCGYNWDSSGEELGFQWLDGSVIIDPRSSKAFTFSMENNLYDELLLADFIAEGVCGGTGTVVPYFFHSGTVWPDTLFNRYLPEGSNSGYNLAESIYMAIRSLSSPSLVIGDPKTSLIMDTLDAIFEHNSVSRLKAFPNPTRNNLNIEYSVSEDAVIQMVLINHLGQIVYSNRISVQRGNQKQLLSLEYFPKGLYVLRLDSYGNKPVSIKLMKN